MLKVTWNKSDGETVVVIHRSGSLHSLIRSIEANGIVISVESYTNPRKAIINVTKEEYRVEMLENNVAKGWIFTDTKENAIDLQLAWIGGSK